MGTPDYRAMILADRPALYAPMDSVTRAWLPTRDVFFHVTQGTPTLSRGRDGTAATAVSSGNNVYFTTPRNYSGELVSYEFWVRLNVATGTQSLMSLFGNTGQIYLRMNAGKLEMVADFVAVICTGTKTITDTNSYHHYVATKNGSTVALYVDGTPCTGTVTNRTIAAASGEHAIGRNYNNAESGSLSMQDYAIYNYELKPSQILNHYRAGRGLSGITQPQLAAKFPPVIPRGNLLTAVSSSTGGTYAGSPSNVLDLDSDSSWTPSNVPAQIVFDLGTSPHSASGCGISAWDQRQSTSWIVESSPDASTWTTQCTFNSVPGGNPPWPHTFLTGSFASVAARYWRYGPVGGSGHFQIMKYWLF